ncbi:MAG: phosphatase PAP2 family protein [Acidobacteriota bacterium]
MNGLDLHLLELCNHALASSRGLFEMALLLCGPLPLVGCVVVLLALWWTDLEGGRSWRGRLLAGGAAPESPGLRISRRRCVSVAQGVAAAFIGARLVAYAVDGSRPLVQESLRIPIEKEQWDGIVGGMLGFGAFPSDHAALFFALAVGLFAWGARLGWAGLVGAACLSFVRIGVGFHYPSDMLAGALMGAGAGLAAWQVERRPARLLDRVVDGAERHPAIFYPSLFVVALDFTQHFKLVFRGVFFFLLGLLGGPSD